MDTKGSCNSRRGKQSTGTAGIIKSGGRIKLKSEGYTEREILAMIIGDKYKKFGQFTQMVPKISIDLFTIENKICATLDYDEHDLRQDLDLFKDQMIITFSKSQMGMEIMDSFEEMLHMITDELESFHKCPSCIGLYYYGFFADVCHPSIHGLVLVYYLPDQTWWPSKTIQVDEDKRTVYVRYFGEHEYEWVPYSRCKLLSVCRLRHYETRQYKKAYCELLNHIHDIQKETGMYFHGYPCIDSEGNPGITFSRRFLYLQKSVLSTEPLKANCNKCHNCWEKNSTERKVFFKKNIFKFANIL